MNIISYKREIKWIIFLFRCTPTLQTLDPLLALYNPEL